MLLVVAHPSFASPLVEVVVRLVDVDAKLAEDPKIFSLETVLLIDRVADVSMMLMVGALARVAVLKRMIKNSVTKKRSPRHKAHLSPA